MSRTLSEEEIRDWQHCSTEPEGKVINWDTAELVINNLNMSEVDRRETCLKTTTDTNYVGYTTERSLRGAQKFCKNLGGKFAVSRDRLSLNEISRVSAEMYNVSLSSCLKNWIYTGFHKTSDNWVDVNTGETMRWNDWSQVYHTKNKDKKCIIQFSDTGKIFNYYCDIKFCPVC